MPTDRPQDAPVPARPATDAASGAPSAPNPRSLAAVAAVFALGGLGFLLMWSDGKELLARASEIDWLRFGLAVAATVASYLLMALSYAGVARAADSPIPFSAMLRITFVSNTVNYIVATGGLSGFAARMYFFRQHGIPLGRAVSISFVQGVLTNVALALFLVLGLFFLIRQNAGADPTIMATATAAFILFSVGTLLALTVLIRPEMRRRLLYGTVHTIYRVGQKVAPGGLAPGRMRLWRMAHKTQRSFEFLLANWRDMIGPTIYILLDWAVTIAVLWLCFWAVDVRLPFPLVTIGFAVGILFSIASAVPGGLGLMEASMTLVFVELLGAPREPAIIAVLLFRLAYFGVPLIVSMSLFRGMMSAARSQTA